ncbi:MAG: hypothetical protein EAY75_08110 [Bacteroidetes bacterium]|nr:MAG: hypothetical protein EAY75_08110 [Bacteroidota bacterium]
MRVLKRMAVVLALLVSNAALCQQIDSVDAQQLVRYIKAAKGIEVVNFWSTLCGPCIKEMPYYIAVVDSFKKMGYQVNLTLVSLDFASDYGSKKLHQFVQQRGWWVAKHFWLNEQYPDEYVPKIDSSWFGALPATQVVNNGVGYTQFYDGTMTREALVAALKAAIARPRR